MKIVLLIITLIFLSTANGGQKFYKWVDEEGNTHYTSEKPEDKKTDEVTIKTNHPQAPKVDPEAQEARRKKSDEFMENHYEKKRKSKELAAVNKKKCTDAKKTLVKFQEKVRMSRVNQETGETEYLEDSSRAQILKDAQKGIKQYCR